MYATQIITMAVAALVLIGGAAAVGAASPADPAHDTATNATDEAPPDHAIDTPAANASELQSGHNETVGPSDGLPAQVADHVSEIHAHIEDFRADTISHLGEHLSELLADRNGA